NNASKLLSPAEQDTALDAITQYYTGLWAFVHEAKLTESFIEWLSHANVFASTGLPTFRTAEEDMQKMLQNSAVNQLLKQPAALIDVSRSLVAASLVKDSASYVPLLHNILLHAKRKAIEHRQDKRQQRKEKKKNPTKSTVQSSDGAEEEDESDVFRDVFG